MYVCMYVCIYTYVQIPLPDDSLTFLSSVLSSSSPLHIPRVIPPWYISGCKCIPWCMGTHLKYLQGYLEGYLRYLEGYLEGYLQQQRYTLKDTFSNSHEIYLDIPSMYMGYLEGPLGKQRYPKRYLEKRSEH